MMVNYFNMSHKSTIGRGFEFVDNIESINLNLVTKCFLTRKPLLIVGLCLLAFVNNIESLNLNAGCFLVGFLGHAQEKQCIHAVLFIRRM